MTNQRNPFLLLIGLTMSVFVLEAIIMLFLSYLPPLHVELELLVDATLLTCSLFPIIYWLAFRPLIREINERQQIAGELERLNNELDNKVREKTSQLLSANEVLTLEVEQRKDVEEKLKATQSQMLLQEKMASIGQLAAGVAHEINNPIGFISSNLNTLRGYVGKIEKFVMSQLGNMPSEELAQLRNKLKIDYILKDSPELIQESIDGTERVTAIVKNLKSFSRLDEEKYSAVNLNDCVEDSLKMIWNELKYKATVTKEFTDLPKTQCFPLQISQVLMNLMVNAAHSIDKQGTIIIKTWHQDGIINIVGSSLFQVGSLNSSFPAMR
ncbi:MAG: hypothetical protein PF441_04945 [Desulfuromusa sp.]|jgi:C4-dicarboxylate-specific signal transduction histidine kinase|nr:hypothetical protein [Desulfuromusa sp.]